MSYPKTQRVAVTSIKTFKCGVLQILRALSGLDLNMAENVSKY